MKQKARRRIFRDAIHGDVPVGPLQTAIVDTPVFQRLRYIRQNGLLHFVFPGATHSRFTHSIGTMHVAGRAFTSLFPHYSPGDPERVSSSCLTYVGQVFETAALLHDCGHVAFSHSTEEINGDDPYLLSLRTYAEEWDEDGSGLSAWIEDQSVVDPDITPTHEELSLLLARAIICHRYPHVADACGDLLGVSPDTLATDVQSLLLPDLPFSQHFHECANAITEQHTQVGSEERPEQLRDALSTLISGTLDVDRMDYLLRDSHHTGTIYGKCDIGVILNALELCVGPRAGPTLYVGLHQRACQAVDDLLWSRYQLFLQVLNHKTNVILNALLADALHEAAKRPSVAEVGRPHSWPEFISFTDAHVISRVISASLADPHADKRMYHKALVDRDIPLYLGSIALPEDEDDAQNQIENRKQKLRVAVDKQGYDPETVSQWISESHLIKGGGLPFVIRKDKLTGKRSILEPTARGAFQIPRWTREGKMPAVTSHAHFFVDREKH